MTTAEPAARGTRISVAILVGGILLVAAPFFEWMRPPGELSRFRGLSGFSSFRGDAVFVIGVLVIIAGLLTIARRLRPGDPIQLVTGLVVTVLPLIATSFAIEFVLMMESLRDEIGTEFFPLTGIGVAVALAGALVAFIAGLGLLLRATHIPEPGSVPEPDLVP